VLAGCAFQEREFLSHFNERLVKDFVIELAQINHIVNTFALSMRTKAAL
jgi:hypothetical protein